MAYQRKTIRIPVNKKTGSVPHWCHDPDDCERRLADMQKLYDAGYLGGNYWKDEADWKTWIDNALASAADSYGFDWREPWEFTDTFVVRDYGRGRSAAYFNLDSQTSERKCIMFMTDITYLIQNATLVKGNVTGRWIFTKRGQNYGVKYLGPVV